MKEIDPKLSIYRADGGLSGADPRRSRRWGSSGCQPGGEKHPGRATTLAQGCEKQGKDFAEVVRQAKEHGFEVKV